MNSFKYIFFRNQRRIINLNEKTTNFTQSKIKSVLTIHSLSIHIFQLQQNWTFFYSTCECKEIFKLNRQ